jgi:hypothetical protein
VILHGVDFSGAESGGAAKIRVVEREWPAPGGHPITVRGRMDRNGLTRAILAGREDGKRHLWRIDAPFGLPLETVTAIGGSFGVPADWRAVAEWMRSLGSPRGWRQLLREVSRREPRRTADRSERTPMAPMNLRVFKQTWTLIVEVLLPLADEGIRIEPVANCATGHRIVVCEGCPASVLERLGWPTRGYKGGGEPPMAVRQAIVDRLAQSGLTITEGIGNDAIRDTEGDLLDALLLLTPPTQTVVPAEAAIEAWVY